MADKYEIPFVNACIRGMGRRFGQTSEAVELFFVLELCRDRAVAYQWVQLGGADFLLGMSKNLTKTG